MKREPIVNNGKGTAVPEAVPTFELLGDGQLSDAAIEALAALLLSLADQDVHKPPEEEEKAQSA